jgi:hypothetical protein
MKQCICIRKITNSVKVEQVQKLISMSLAFDIIHNGRIQAAAVTSSHIFFLYGYDHTCQYGTMFSNKKAM